jgi:virginiamycin B lyase
VLSQFRSRRARRAMLLKMALIAVSLGCIPLQAEDLTVTGVLKDATGHPVAGALVKVKGDELSFMVVTQSDGRYSTPNLVPGKYAVQGFSADSQSTSMGPVEVSASQPGKMDLTLNAPLQLPSPQKRMTDADYAQLMPAGDGKSSVASRCATCHSLLWIVSARKTPEKWQETVDRMRDDLQGRDRPLNDILGESDLLQLDLMAEYLGKNFTPDKPVDPRVVEQWITYPGAPSHPNRNLPGALLKGAASRYVAMEFSLASNTEPHDIAVAPNGIAWVSEANTGMLGRFDPKSLTYSGTAVPAGKTPKPQLNSVAVDPTGQVWFADDGPNARMLQYDPGSGQFTSYPIPEYRYPIPPDFTPARLATLRFFEGNVWATGLVANWIVKLDPHARKTTEYPVPKGSAPYGLAIGGDHRVWYAAEVGNLVGRLDPANGRLTEYDLATAKSDIRGMAADGEGNLWVAANESGKLLKVDYRNGNFTEFTPPSPNPGPFAIDVDTMRNLVWISEISADKLARFDPRSGAFVEFPLPSADLDVRRIEVDRSNPNRVWWSGGRASKVGYIEVTE